MRFLLSGLFAALLVSTAACNGGEEDGGPKECSDGARTCGSNSDCDLGYNCQSECCRLVPGCTPTSCGPGEFCNDLFECASIADLCLSAADCECHILNQAGQLPAEGDATLVLAGETSRVVKAVLAITEGPILPGAEFTWSITDGAASFSVTDDAASPAGELTATDVSTGSPSTARLVATSGIITCEATIVNLGSAPAAGDVRFFVYDDLTGAPVPTADLIVDTDADGATDVGALATSPGGLATTTVGVPFTVTVIKDGYNFLSVVGIDPAAGNDIALPLTPRPSPATTGGFTGQLDYDRYELLRGEQDLKLAAVASSFPVKAFLNFDLSLFFGGFADVDCSTNPQTTPGCYHIDIDSPVNVDTWAPLPGGLVAALGNNEIKGHFDSVGLPGRRYAWALGTDLDLGELGDLINLALAFFNTGGGGCDCDVTESVCDPDGTDTCECDLDCLDVGEVFNALMPVLPKFASAAQGNVPLVEAPIGEWETYTGVDFGSRASSADFPLLDNGVGGDYPELMLRQLLTEFTSYQAPTLPADPTDTTGNTLMEGLLVVTGVNATGAGFVPLGLGAGLDCTGVGCLDGTGEFDGEINGAEVCNASTSVEDDECDDLPGLPADGRLADGRLGVFHALAHSGLEFDDWVTVAVALPISQLLNGSGIRATAVVMREEPPSGDDATTGVIPDGFAAFPTMPADADGRVYVAPATAGIDVQWVTVSSPEDANGVTRRWNIYFPGSGGTFVAPSVTGTDPFAGEDDPETEDVDETGTIDVTHVGFDMGGKSFSTLVGNDADTLTDVGDLIEAFSAQNQRLPITP